ncbi:LOW QUALITY PROTEIN: uncharacterized protein jeb [Drosophila tropicalis]|uniref:LOW QUALITY PROTEIN: uncharacterized protein jeb n=1 Tax=Drosophila tropicalis TaxID=46794 RepID=UPI0035ABFFAE
MFFSLAQTLVCVLLIQGGLYALHLSGNGEKASGLSSSSSSSSASAISSSTGSNMIGGGIGGVGSAGAIAASSNWQPQQHPGGAPPGGGSQHPHPHPHHRSAAAAAFDATTGRLNKELADMAQLERERLMLLGLAKQTAEQTGPAGPPTAGHHGRPIIAGRIQMQPTEDLEAGDDYPSLLQQAARNFMFGSIQKQPPAPPLVGPNSNLDEDYEQLREYGRRPVKYDYGRVVQPMDRERLEPDTETEYEPLHSFGDFDDFSELEPLEPVHLGEDELLRELDAYQYHGLEDEGLPENPYRSLEQQLELNAPDALQQLFEPQSQPETQRDAPAPPKLRTHSPNSNYNIRMQQKWARKRAQGQQQPQLPLQRNIFGQHFKQQQQQRGKLALANSEATASKHLKASTRSGSISNSQDNEKSTNDGPSQKSHESAAAAGAVVGAAATSTLEQEKKEHKEQQQQQQQKDHKEPNHKRSGGSGTAGYAAPPVSHSIASQLMLRTARGQRQYDVPQIECPTAMDGMERFACPTPDLQGRYRCIDDHVLCDGFIDCPEGEDEDRRSCMFYKTTKAHLDVLADALLRWARGR